MRRPSKDSSNKLTADSQRLVTFAQAIVQAASRIEERAWEHNLDTQLQKLLKSGHQDTIDTTLGSLFKEDLNAYDVLMDCVEAVSESIVVTHEEDGVAARYDALLVAVPILSWPRARRSVRLRRRLEASRSLSSAHRSRALDGDVCSKMGA